MEPQALELLFIAMLTLLFGMGFYVARLWLRLREINRSTNQFVIIQPMPIQQEIQPAGGCAGFLLWFFSIVMMISIILLYV